MSQDHAETKFYIVLISDSPDPAGRGSLPTVWKTQGEPTEFGDEAWRKFCAAASEAGSQIVALVEVTFTDWPALRHRDARVTQVVAWSGPLGLMPGVHPGGGFWESMGATALTAIVRHLALASTRT